MKVEENKSDINKNSDNAYRRARFMFDCPTFLEIKKLCQIVLEEKRRKNSTKYSTHAVSKLTFVSLESRFAKFVFFLFSCSD